MRTVLLLLLALAIPSVRAGSPSLDLVLLFQDSPDIKIYFPNVGLRAFRDGDRVGVMMFGKKPDPKLPITADLKQVEATIYKIHPDGSRRRPHLWDALAAACAMFSGPPDATRRRAVIVLFTGEDQSSKETGRSVRSAAAAAGVVISGAVVAKLEPLSEAQRSAQTPPVAGGGLPITFKHGPLSETAFDTLANLARDTHGLALREQWDLPKLVEQIRAGL